MEKNELLRELNELCCPLGIYSKCRIQKIYDPKQDFAMYGLTKTTVDSAKRMLKKRGGQYFRVVKNRYGFCILCFKIKNDVLLEKK